MFPIRDLNPSRITPIVTFVLIAVNVIVFSAGRRSPTQGQGEAFTYERAAIACEIRLGRPLTFPEIRRDECLAQPS